MNENLLVSKKKGMFCGRKNCRQTFLFVYTNKLDKIKITIIIIFPLKYTLTEAEDEAVPLAAGPHDHKCCILHFLLMGLALLVEALYTKSMKKHQGKIFETRRELAELKRKNRSAA